MRLIKLLWASAVTTTLLVLVLFIGENIYEWPLRKVYLPETAWSALFLLIVSWISWVWSNRLINYHEKCQSTPFEFWGALQGIFLGILLAPFLFWFFGLFGIRQHFFGFAFLSGVIAENLFFLLTSLQSKSYTRDALDESPIENDTEDSLSADVSVEEIVSVIGPQWNRGGSIVAVYGPNGIGKSSCINLAVARLRTDYPDILCTVFEPYHYATESEMVRSFFRAMTAPLDNKYALPGISETPRKLTSLAYGISAGGPLSLQVGRLLEFVFPPENFESLQERIENYLEVLEKRILVIVDDIDRCSFRNREIFFQMVNSIKGLKRVRIIISASANELFLNETTNSLE